MIYPTNTGKSGEHLRLSTLESVWIQGKLRMWGRWSYIGGGKTGNMFNQLLASKKLTKTAINDALRRMKKAGLEKPELEVFLREMINGKQKKLAGTLYGYGSADYRSGCRRGTDGSSGAAWYPEPALRGAGDE